MNTLRIIELKKEIKEHQLNIDMSRGIYFDGLIGEKEYKSVKETCLLAISECEKQIKSLLNG